MNSSINLKIFLGIIYLVIFSVGIYFLLSVVDIKDLTNYEFIKSNKEIISKYKNDNFLFITVAFIIFSILWVLLLGFALPLLIFSGFVFGAYVEFVDTIPKTASGKILRSELK